MCVQSSQNVIEQSSESSFLTKGENSYQSVLLTAWWASALQVAGFRSGSDLDPAWGWSHSSRSEDCYTNRTGSSWRATVTGKWPYGVRDDLSSYQTELTTLIKLSPAGLAMTCDEVVPVVMDVPMVGRGIVMTGRGWLRASCCWAKGVRRAGCDWLWTMGGSEGVGVTERGAERKSAGCGVEHGVLVGVGVDGLGVPDPKAGKWANTEKNKQLR